MMGMIMEPVEEQREQAELPSLSHDVLQVGLGL
jgi:hypothetical protein